MQHSEINWKLSFIQRMYRDDAVLHLCAALKWKIYSRMRFEPIFEAMVKAVVASQSYITSCCNMRSVCGEQTRFFFSCGTTKQMFPLSERNGAETHSQYSNVGFCMFFTLYH